jgi:hypothetical protein
MTRAFLLCNNKDMASRTIQKRSHAGAPRRYETAEALQAAIDQFFNQCDSRLKTFVDKDGNETTALVPSPYTISGLALAIGLDRARLIEYGNNDEFYNVVKAARQRCEADIERRLLESSNQAGAIFWLKNNAQWRDQTEQTVTSKGEQTVIYRPEKLPEPTIEGEIVSSHEALSSDTSS